MEVLTVMTVSLYIFFIIFFYKFNEKLKNENVIFLVFISLQLKDCVALCEFFAWIEQEVQSHSR